MLSYAQKPSESAIAGVSSGLQVSHLFMYGSSKGSKVQIDKTFSVKFRYFLICQFKHVFWVLIEMVFFSSLVEK